MKSVRLIFLLLWCVLPLRLPAQALELNLDASIERALTHNLSIRSSLIDVHAAQRDKDTSWNLFLPVVRATLSNSGRNTVFQDSPVIKPMIKGNSGLSAGLSLSLTLNPALQQQLQSFDLNYQVQQVTYAQAALEVKRNVTKLFFYLLAERENLLLLQKGIELAQQNLGKVRVSFESGHTSELEVLSAELGVQRLLPSLGQSRNTYHAQMMAFKVLLGLDLDEEVELVGVLPMIGSTPALEDLNAQVGLSPRLRLIDLNVLSLENSAKLQRRYDSGPSITFSGQYGISVWDDNPLYATVDFIDTIQYTVSVAIPLDAHIPNSRAQVSLAKIADSMEKLQLSRAQTVQQMKQSLRTQLATLENLTEQMDLAMANRNLAQRVYEMTATQYESGYADALALADARNDLLAAEQNMLYLQYQHASAKVDLAYDLNLEPDFL